MMKRYAVDDFVVVRYRTHEGAVNVGFGAAMPARKQSSAVRRISKPGEYTSYSDAVTTIDTSLSYTFR